MAIAVPPPNSRIITITMTDAPDDNNPADVERHRQLRAAFKLIRPDVVVEAHQGSFDKTTFLTRFAAGTMEDAYLVPFTEPQTLIANNQAADITDLIKGWEHYASFNPEVLQIVKNRPGQIYGVPVNGYALGLIYNRKLFKEAGLDPDKPPTTWDEMREFARQLTDPTKGQAGFAELSKSNQGGWHFTAWKYSFGGDLQQIVDGTWKATFNDENGVKVLQTLKTMRWVDKSMTEQQQLDVDDVLPLLATERVAMALMAGDALQAMKTQYQAQIEDFGIGPLPQGGGNATLAGGAAWLFNPNSAPEVRQAAFEWTMFRDFSLAGYESDLKGLRERDALVGWPQLPLFIGSFQQQREDVLARYANAPVENYRAFNDATLRLRAEPEFQTQKMYAVLDTAMHAILADPATDPQQALDAAVREYQALISGKP